MSGRNQGADCKWPEIDTQKVWKARPSEMSLMVPDQSNPQLKIAIR